MTLYNEPVKLNPADVQLIEATKPNPKPFCVIPARKGSKRIKNKNKRLLNGRPLIDYALKAAIESDVFGLIVITSDDMDILELAYSYFHTNMVQPHLRPTTLCGDDIPLKVVIRYCIQSYQFGEDICLIQPTNPLITSEQIKEAFNLYKGKKADYLIAQADGKDIGFHFFKKKRFLNDYEKLWDMKGLKWIPYEVDGIDIDTIDEFMMCEAKLTARDSICQRLKVGTIAVKDGTIISRGFNGYGCVLEDNVCPKTKYLDPLLLGRTYEEGSKYCKGVHAEVLCLKDSSIDFSGATLYTTMRPCADCTRIIENSGIAKVIWKEPYDSELAIKAQQESEVIYERLSK